MGAFFTPRQRNSNTTIRNILSVSSLLIQILSFNGSSILVSAASSEKEWSKVKVFRPINDYNDGNLTAIPAPPSHSGFDTAMNLHGDIVAVASRLKIDSAFSKGLVQVYHQEGYSDVQENNESKPWTQLGQDIIVETEGDWYGKNVIALNENGDRIAIGSRLVNGGSGEVMVFEYDTTGKSWGQLGDTMQGTIDTHFGASVSLSADGSTLAIGSPFQHQIMDTDILIGRVGKVTIMKFVSDSDSGSGATWTQTFSVVGESQWDEFGTSVAISAQGDLFAAGAPLNDPESNKINAGHVRVYAYSGEGDVWSKLGPDIDGENALDQSASSIALSYDKINSKENRVAIGAPYSDPDNLYLYRTGHVRVFDFDRQMSMWSRLYYDIIGESHTDFSGKSVAMNKDGTILVIGATGSDGADGNLKDAGHARIFEASQQLGWAQLGQDLDGFAAEGAFGSSVQINGAGTRVVVGAPTVGSDQGGAVYVYDLFEKYVVTEAPTSLGVSDDTSDGSINRIDFNMLGGMIGIIAVILY